MITYGVITGGLKSDLQKVFDVVSDYEWPIDNTGTGTGATKEYTNKAVWFIVESLNWGAEHDQILQDKKSEWDSGNVYKVPTNLKQKVLQSERLDITAQYEQRKSDLEQRKSDLEI